MPQKAKRLHDEWKRSDELAREGERQIASEWEAFFAGEGSPPTLESLQLVRDMRTAAAARLAELMEYMRTASAPD